MDTLLLISWRVKLHLLGYCSKRSEIIGISFEWDDNKAAINEAKHHITFSEASTVFADENAILFDDPNHSQEEERFMMLGLSDHAKMLIVCHCYRGMDDVIRIISARKATKNETTQYYKINERW